MTDLVDISYENYARLYHQVFEQETHVDWGEWFRYDEQARSFYIRDLEEKVRQREIDDRPATYQPRTESVIW